jgi:hypothetical protein
MVEFLSEAVQAAVEAEGGIDILLFLCCRCANEAENKFNIKRFIVLLSPTRIYIFLLRTLYSDIKCLLS